MCCAATMVKVFYESLQELDITQLIFDIFFLFLQYFVCFGSVPCVVWVVSFSRFCWLFSLLRFRSTRAIPAHPFVPKKIGTFSGRRSLNCISGWPDRGTILDGCVHRCNEWAFVVEESVCVRRIKPEWMLCIFCAKIFFLWRISFDSKGNQFESKQRRGETRWMKKIKKKEEEEKERKKKPSKQPAQNPSCYVRVFVVVR